MGELAIVEKFLKVASPARVPDGGLPETDALDALRAVVADESLRDEHRAAAAEALALFPRKTAAAIGALAAVAGGLPDIGEPPKPTNPDAVPGAGVAKADGGENGSVPPGNGIIVVPDGWTADEPATGLVSALAPPPPRGRPPLAERVIAWAKSVGAPDPPDRRELAMKALEYLETGILPGEDDRRAAAMMLAAMRDGADADAEFVLDNLDRLRAVMARPRTPTPVLVSRGEGEK